MQAAGGDGYELWLRYLQVDDPDRLAQYHNAIGNAVVLGTNATAAIVRSELARALPALLGSPVPFSEKPAGNALVVGAGDELAERAGQIDPQRHAHVARRLEEQLESARLWREACLEYFGRFG